MTGTAQDFLFGHFSHQGPRETNQDTVLSIQLPDNRWLVAVADGMGGLAQGELASKTALGTLYRHLSEGTTLILAVMEANAAVLRESQTQGMGTTLVAAVLSGDSVEIANVGDSRAYHYDPLGLVQVTQDHTLADEAARAGSLVDDEAAASPWGGALSRYLGAGKEVDVDYFGPLEIHERGWFLLCSDGLYRVFSNDELDTFLSTQTNPETAARRLVEEALKRNSQDNVSVALVFRPAREPEAEPARIRRTRESAWDPGRFVIRPERPRSRKKDRRPLAATLSLVIIPLSVGLALAWWWFSARTG